MKTTKLLTLCLGIFLTTLTAAAAKTTAKPTGKDTLTVNVNMDCHDCEKKIGDQLRFEKGVTNMAIELNKQKVTVVYRTNKTDTATLCGSIRKLGYVVKPWKE
jgi:periplasmic mercuric ion binding protein